MILLVLWIGLAFALAGIGSGKKIGYWGSFALCLFLSPLLGMIITLCLPSEDSPTKTYKCKHCQLTTTINSHYCPRCFKDSDGFTANQNTERFNVKI